MLNHLSACVDRQLALYRKLLTLFHDERSAILASDLEELNRVVVDKETILQHIRREEVQRRQAADALASDLGLDAGALTLSQLALRLTDAPGAEELQERGTRLQSLLEEIQVESERNRSLCLHALQFVGRSIKLLSTLTHPNRVYHATGRVQNDGHIGRMLSGAV